MGGESCNLVPQTLAGDDGNLIADTLVGVEVEGEARVVLLDDDAGSTLGGLCTNSTLGTADHRLAMMLGFFAACDVRAAFWTVGLAELVERDMSGWLTGFFSSA